MTSSDAPDTVDMPTRSSRRDFLRKSAIAGGAAWAAPTILSLGPSAFATEGSPVMSGCTGTTVSLKYNVDTGFEGNAGSFGGCDAPDGYANAEFDVNSSGQIDGMGPAIGVTLNMEGNKVVSITFQFDSDFHGTVSAPTEAEAKSGNNCRYDEDGIVEIDTIANTLTISRKGPNDNSFNNALSHAGAVVCLQGYPG